MTLRLSYLCNSRTALAALSLSLLLVSPLYASEKKTSPAQSEELKITSEDAPVQKLTTEQLAQVVEDGKKLASEKCLSCHSIGQTDISSNKEAPPFREFADKWPLESLEESLAEGIVTGHEDMPEFVLNPQEITAFLEYLRTLHKQ